MAWVRDPDGRMLEWVWQVGDEVCDLNAGGHLVNERGEAVSPPPEFQAGLATLKYVNGVWLHDLEISI